MDDILLSENKNRFTLFPITDNDIWDAYKLQQRATWTAEEIDYSADLDDWETLGKDERYFIENILAFFAGSDGIVLENLIQNFCNEVQLPEAKCVYSYQAYIAKSCQLSTSRSDFIHTGLYISRSRAFLSRAWHF